MTAAVDIPGLYGCRVWANGFGTWCARFRDDDVISFQYASELAGLAIRRELLARDVSREYVMERLHVHAYIVGAHVEWRESDADDASGAYVVGSCLDGCAS